MSNQLYSNGIQIGSPSPPTSYLSDAPLVTGDLVINGPVSGLAHDYVVTAEGRIKTLILLKYTGLAVTTGTSWTSFQLLDPQFTPSYKQTFVVPIIINNNTIPGFFEFSDTGFFTIKSPTIPLIGLAAGWEDISISYI
jgi:hypothetical protein